MFTTFLWRRFSMMCCGVSWPGGPHIKGHGCQQSCLCTDGTCWHSFQFLSLRTHLMMSECIALAWLSIHVYFLSCSVALLVPETLASNGFLALSHVLRSGTRRIEIAFRACACLCIPSHVCACHAHSCLCMAPHACACLRLLAHTCVCPCMHACTCTCACLRMLAHACACPCMPAHACACLLTPARAGACLCMPAYACARLRMPAPFACLPWLHMPVHACAGRLRVSYMKYMRSMCCTSRKSKTSCMNYMSYMSPTVITTVISMTIITSCWCCCYCC